MCVQFDFILGIMVAIGIFKSNKAIMGIHKQKLNTMGIKHRVVKENGGYRFYVGDLKKIKKVKKSW